MSSEAILLLSLLLVAHTLGDFTPLATRGMREAKAGIGPAWPIALHAVVHGILVLGAVAVVRPFSWRLLAGAAAIEYATHLLIDFAKMRLVVRYRILQNPAGGPFWYLFGVDQLSHALVLLGIAALVTS